MIELRLSGNEFVFNLGVDVDRVNVSKRYRFVVDPLVVCYSRVPGSCLMSVGISGMFVSTMNCEGQSFSSRFGKMTFTIP